MRAPGAMPPDPRSISGKMKGQVHLQHKALPLQGEGRGAI